MAPDNPQIDRSTAGSSLKRRPRSLLRRGRRVLALSRNRRLLFLRAVPIVAMIRLGLWTLHPSYVMRRVERAVESRLSDAQKRQPARVGEIAWAVRAASRRIPGASCLVQALAARLLLADYGKTSELRIGVARGEEGQIDAHAWLEVAGIPVVGGSGIGRFTVFRDLDGALPVAPGRFKNV